MIDPTQTFWYTVQKQKMNDSSDQLANPFLFSLCTIPYFIQFIFNKKISERSLKIIIDDILLYNSFGHKTQDLFKNTE